MFTACTSSRRCGKEGRGYLANSSQFHLMILFSFQRSIFFLNILSAAKLKEVDLFKLSLTDSLSPGVHGCLESLY